MAISNNIYDRDKAAYKENTNDNGLDRRVTDVTAQSKLDDVNTNILALTAAVLSLIEILTNQVNLLLIDNLNDQLVDDISDNLVG
jgi:hypothetical protein